MSDSNTNTKPKAKVELQTERPKLHKVILVNDDYTPREFVVLVLKAEFRVSEDQAMRVMMTAHRRGACVVAGAFTLLPSRFLGQLVWHQWLGWV